MIYKSSIQKFFASTKFCLDPNMKKEATFYFIQLWLVYYCANSTDAADSSFRCCESDKKESVNYRINDNGKYIRDDFEIDNERS